MKKFYIVCLLVMALCPIGFTQNNLCSEADPYCTGSTYNIPAPVNEGNAEAGPDYGCLTSQPNPVWYFLNIDQPGNIQLDIHTDNGKDINYICWGPFPSQTAPCTAGLTSDKIIGCSYSSSNQEWCNIPNTISAPCGEYYILLISNYSNQAANIIMVQTNNGQTGAGTTNCNCCICDFNAITYSVSECNPSNNKYSVSGNQLFHIVSPFLLSGQLNIVDQPSGISQVFEGPFSCSTSPIAYNLNNISSDGLQHTVTAYFTDASNCIWTETYTAPGPCNACFANAGTPINVCGLSGTLNAIENSGDINTHWITQSEVSYGAINSPTSTIAVNTYGTYNLVWQITNNSGITCTDTITVEFIDPAQCTSILDNSIEESFSIFPNPTTNGNFKINYTSKERNSISIRILNIQGIEIFNKTYMKNNETIEFPIELVNVVKGYYIIELNNGNKISRKPLIIQ